MTAHDGETGRDLRNVPCVCEHPHGTHRGRIVPIDDEGRAHYARLLGSCSSCSCPCYDPAHLVGQ